MWLKEYLITNNYSAVKLYYFSRIKSFSNFIRKFTLCSNLLFESNMAHKQMGGPSRSEMLNEIFNSSWIFVFLIFKFKEWGKEDKLKNMYFYTVFIYSFFYLFQTWISIPTFSEYISRRETTWIIPKKLVLHYSSCLRNRGVITIQCKHSRYSWMLMPRYREMLLNENKIVFI